MIYFKIYDNYIKFSHRLLQASLDVRKNIQTEMQQTLTSNSQSASFTRIRIPGLLQQARGKLVKSSYAILLQLPYCVLKTYEFRINALSQLPES